MEDMKTSIVVTLGLATTAILILVGFLIYTDKDITPLLIALPVVATTLGTLFGLNQLTKKVETVQAQTNGTLSALRAEIETKNIEISALRTQLTPEQAAVIDTDKRL